VFYQDAAASASTVSWHLEESVRKETVKSGLIYIVACN